MAEQRQVPEWKKYMVKELRALVNKYTVVGILSLSNLPSEQLQSIRRELRGRARIVTAKKSIISHALKGTEYESLIGHIGEIPSLILTDMDGFKLMKLINDKTVPSYAKPGQVAPEDIVVKAGMTQFPAGPMISDFAQVGIKTKVTNGKLEIIKDTIVAEKDSTIDENKANILKKIDIKSVKVGLTLIAIYDNGTTFTADQLQIDTADYINKIGLAHTQAFNLSIEAAIPVKDNIETLLAKANNEAFNLAIEASIAVKEVINKLLSIGTSQARALAEDIKNKYEVNQ